MVGFRCPLSLPKPGFDHGVGVERRVGAGRRFGAERWKLQKEKEEEMDYKILEGFGVEHSGGRGSAEHRHGASSTMLLSLRRR